MARLRLAGLLIIGDSGVVDIEPPRHAQLTLPNDAAGAALARDFARRLLVEWNYRGSLDDAVLLVSELVTNAMRHGSGTRTLRLGGNAGRVRIEVADSSPTMPAVRAPGSDGGWGLRLVDRLSAAWGVIPSAGGKLVWCELRPQPVNEAVG